ncbi:hypothetical protein O3M35_013131 [Rhynocoris fuscipes]|uniref:Uncharacterized protein n=1 Tax=Rhynocoris fuscipes TaxID=488301 RepID=A0AAW1CET8_9HEMI
MAEVQTDIVFKELEAKQVCFMCTSANVVESDTSEMSSRTDNECQTYDAELSQAESEILKMLYEQAEQRCTILKDKLDIALAKLESLEAEQRRNSAKSPSLLCQESQTQVELYEETKECQTSFEAEFVKKLNIYLDSLEIDDGRKNCLRPCVNESASYDKLFHHIKTVYDVIENTDKCNRDNEKRVKLLEKTNAELIKGKEKLEKRTQKLSEICKAFQGLNEVQEKELRHYNDTKTTLAEKTRQCEFLTKRIADLEVVIRKIKDRKNDFKKKYFKEKQANKKMKKEKNHINWLSKIFDWKQLAPT